MAFATRLNSTRKILSTNCSKQGNPLVGQTSIKRWVGPKVKRNSKRKGSQGFKEFSRNSRGLRRPRTALILWGRRGCNWLSLLIKMKIMTITLSSLKHLVTRCHRWSTRGVPWQSMRCRPVMSNFKYHGARGHGCLTSWRRRKLLCSRKGRHHISNSLIRQSHDRISLM